MVRQLDSIDIAILQALMEDGRKSFRQISRETGISTPTVKARFDQMVRRGFIKSVSPVLDLGKIKDDKTRLELEMENKKKGIKQLESLTRRTLENNKS